jgi:hypothetical protein
LPTDGRVEADANVGGERKVTGRCVADPAVVKDKRISSNGCVLGAGGVKQKRCRANCGIGSPVVERQRSTANTGIEAGVGIRKERTPTNCSVSRARGVVNERIVTEKRVEMGAVATLLANRLRFCQKRKAGHQRQDDK